VRGKPSAVARWVLSEPTHRKETINRIANIVKAEIKTLCSDDVNSIMKCKEKDK
jgi:hypothetical protein